MASKKFFEELLQKKKNDKPKYIDELYKVPVKDKGVNKSIFLPVDENIVQQADLLFLPTDNGHKYALVVADIGSGLTDAEPMKDKKAKNILDGLKKIYARGTLKIPKVLQVDAGNEFKGEVIIYFKKKKVAIKVAKPNRHRQQAIVENRNKTIGKSLHRHMTSIEALTGEENREWVDNLPTLIEVMNNKQKKKGQKIIKRPIQPVCKGESCKMLPIGTKVRVMLDAPKDNVYGKRLHGTFRSSDIRYETTIKEVTDILLRPQAPPMYIINRDYNTAYTKNQLQKVKANEQMPDKELVKNNEANTYIVEKIIGKRKFKNKIQYRIKWKGYDESQSTWNYKSQLLYDNPNLQEDIDEYENNNQ